MADASPTGSWDRKSEREAFESLPGTPGKLFEPDPTGSWKSEMLDALTNPRKNNRDGWAPGGHGEGRQTTKTATPGPPLI